MAKQSSKSDARAENLPGFEESLAQLEGVVRELEEGEIGLNAALERYEKGVTLLRHCHKLLGQAERKIEMLSGVDAEGNPVARPFEDEALSLDEKAQRRTRRRTSPSSEPSPPEAGAADLDETRGPF